MTDDDLKRRILARRAKFVAAAIASMSVIGTEACGSSQPCLFPAVGGNSDATADTGDPSFPDATGPVVDGRASDATEETVDGSDAALDGAVLDGGDGG